jgi:hypothetical protein
MLSNFLTKLLRVLFELESFLEKVSFVLACLNLSEKVGWY